jgi:hypothetical protein
MHLSVESQKNALFASLMQGIFLPRDNPAGIIQKTTI